jgi:hypothetical protein
VTRQQALEEFWLAIHALWRAQYQLGQAHARGAPPQERARYDPAVKAAMDRVAYADEMVKAALGR